MGLEITTLEAREQEEARQRAMCSLAQRIVRARRARSEGTPNGISAIVFSRDRPMQLHALLRSLFELVAVPPELFILYRASDYRYEQAYEACLEQFGRFGVHAAVETAFRDGLLSTLDRVTTDRVLFLVDDIIFTRPVDFIDLAHLDPLAFVVSLRLGEHIRRSYTRGCPVRLPPFVEGVISDPAKLCWVWDDGEHDWQYPLSVDGHIFSTAEVRDMVRSIVFFGPNTLEGNLQVFAPIFRSRWGVCYRQARIVNVPHNKVQSENANLFSGGTADDLLRRWEANQQIDIEVFRGLAFDACHHEFDFRFHHRP
jgi:hypothetical protein